MNEGHVIAVRWGVSEAGTVRGRIMIGGQGLRKGVRIDERCSGFCPYDREVTWAEVVRDSRPNDPMDGVLYVRPVFHRPSNALSHKAAMRELRELVRSRSLGVRDTYIPVDLPGWRGALTYVVRDIPGPLQVQWIFHAASGTARIETLIFRVLSSALTHERGVTRVLNWKRAIDDLGEPTEVETNLNDRFLVRWHGITAELPDEVALAGGADLQNIRLEGLQVMAGLSLFEGRWQKTVVLGHGERVEGTTVHYASFNPRFSMTLRKEVRTQVKELLRSTRHSLAWHQAMVARDLVDEDLQGTRIWEEIDKIDQLTKGFAPLWLLRARLQELHALRSTINEQCATERVFAGEQDARIYKATLAPEADLPELTKRNEGSLKDLDEAIVDLRETVERVRLLHKQPAYRQRIQGEIERLRVAVFPSTPNPEVNEPSTYLGIRMSALCTKVSEYLERGSIEDALNQLLELQEIVAQQSS